MEHPSFLDRIRGWARRVLFWLPSAAPSEEQAPELNHDHALVISVVAPKRVPPLAKLRHIWRFLSPAEARVFVIALLCAVISLGAAGMAFAFERLVTVPVGGPRPRPPDLLWPLPV
jgi:hypothetical protein